MVTTEDRKHRYVLFELEGGGRHISPGRLTPTLPYCYENGAAVSQMSNSRSQETTSRGVAKGVANAAMAPSLRLKRFFLFQKNYYFLFKRAPSEK